MRRLVLLRPEPGASESAARAAALGIAVIREPLFRVEGVAWRAPPVDHYDALLLTSANAVAHGGAELERLRLLPVQAVGAATAEAARAAGFTVTGVGRGGIDALLARLPAGLRLLHLAGEDRYPPQGRAWPTRVITVYRAAAIEPQGDFTERLRGTVVAIHSPRAAERLAALVSARSTIAVVAISPQAAAGSGSGWEQIAIARWPNDPALLASAAQLCL